MKYRILSPQLPELVPFALERNLPKGFYASQALPFSREIVIEFSELPPETDILINNSLYRTDSEGKVVFTLVNPQEFSDLQIVLVYKEGTEERTNSVGLLVRQYVNLVWIVESIFLESYLLLWAQRLLLTGDAERKPLHVFKRVTKIEESGEDLESITNIELANSLWSEFTGGLFYPNIYPGIGNILGSGAYFFARLLLNAFSDIRFFYYLERLISAIFGIEPFQVRVGFLPFSRNFWRLGFSKDVFEKIDLSKPEIVWSDFSSFVREVLFNSLFVPEVESTHTLPPLPTEEGFYLLVYSPNFEAENWEECLAGEEAYNWVALSGESEPPPIGYHIEEVSLKLIWNSERKEFLSPIPILSFNHSLELSSLTGNIVSNSYQKSFNLFKFPNFGDDSFGGTQEEVITTAVGVVPYIPILLIYVDDEGNPNFSAYSEITDLNKVFLSMKDSLSGVDVFVSIQGLSDTFSDTEIKSISKLIWLALEKATIPSIMSIGWLGPQINTLGVPVRHWMFPYFCSVHRRRT